MRAKAPFFLAVIWIFVSCGSPEKETPPSPETQENTSAPAPAPEIQRYPPAPDLPPAPDTLRIAVISDINGSYGTIGYSPLVHAAVNDIISRGYDFVVSPGDLIAGQRHGVDYDSMWRAFHYEIGDVFFDNNLEFIFAPGNHDASAYAGHEDARDAYARAFENRRPKAPLLPGSHFPFYYGVMIRGVRVIALDITRPVRDNDPQVDWLAETLASPEKTRLTLVLGHFPLSPVHFTHIWDIAGSRRLMSILSETPDLIYISGHNHVYYPGHIGEIRTIAAPALGAGARSLMGAPAVSGYVQIIVPPQAPARVTALVAPDFKRMVNRAALPEVVFSTQREDVGMARYIVDLIDDEAH
ncbi:MAG: metallophosphoesterase [Proteobacteria bacterium]|nr:metallophosphoesterase [Pseudomonadota bacterium]